MVEKLKESENKLESMLADKEPDNIEVPAEEADETSTQDEPPLVKIEDENTSEKISNQDKSSNKNTDNTTLKKVTNFENEQLNKTLHNVKAEETQQESKMNELSASDNALCSSEHMEKIEEKNEDAEGDLIDIQEIESTLYPEEIKKDDQHMNDMLRKNILSCVEKVARIEEMKTKTRDSSATEDQVSVC